MGDPVKLDMSTAKPINNGGVTLDMSTAIPIGNSAPDQKQSFLDELSSLPSAQMPDTWGGRIWSALKSATGAQGVETVHDLLGLASKHAEEKAQQLQHLGEIGALPPTAAGIGVGAARTVRDAANVGAGMTTPTGAVMTAGAVIPVTRIPTMVAGMAMGGKQIVDANSNPNLSPPDRLQQRLMGAAGVMGSAALAGNAPIPGLNKGPTPPPFPAPVPKSTQALASLLDPRAGKVNVVEAAQDVQPLIANQLAKQGVKPSAITGQNGGKVVLDAIDAAKTERENFVSQASKPFLQDAVDMRPIAKSYRDMITPELRNNEPATAQAIED